MISELPKEHKQMVLNGLLFQVQQAAFSNETQGQIWKSFGDDGKAKLHADALAENMKMISELKKRIDELA